MGSHKRIENELRLLTKMPENENEMTISEETDDIEVVVNNTGYDIFVYNDELIILKSVADNKFFLLDLNHENIINYEGEE
jgi:ribosomal 30S subunit maturation factor RimM